MTSRVRIAPSILAADFAQLGREAQRLQAAGSDALHVDVMDGHFVRNLTMGPQVVSALRASSSLFLDVHLMIYQPFDFVDRFAAAGARRITFHYEATEDIEDTIALIRGYGLEVGLAISPETSETLILPYLDKIDLLLIMTVNPGFGGQPFIEEMTRKIAFIDDALEGKIPEARLSRSRESLSIQVDGGLNDRTAAVCRAAGADQIVAGSWLFAQPDLERAIKTLRGE